MLVAARADARRSAARRRRSERLESSSVTFTACVCLALRLGDAAEPTHQQVAGEDRDAADDRDGRAGCRPVRVQVAGRGGADQAAGARSDSAPASPPRAAGSRRSCAPSRAPRTARRSITLSSRSSGASPPAGNSTSPARSSSATVSAVRSRVAASSSSAAPSPSLRSRACIRANSTRSGIGPVSPSSAIAAGNAMPASSASASCASAAGQARSRSRFALLVPSPHPHKRRVAAREAAENASTGVSRSAPSRVRCTDECRRDNGAARSAAR